MTRRGWISQLLFGSSAMLRAPESRTLVCVFLRGGADTLNMVTPFADDRYHRLRPTLALKPPGADSDALLKIDDSWGLHPRMEPLLPLYHEGRMAVVQGVGNDNPTGSHFECQDQVERGIAYGEAAGGGWLGRHLRSRNGPPPGPLSAISIGATLPELLRGAPSASALRSLEDIDIRTPVGDPELAADALSRLYQLPVGLLGEQGRATVELFRRVKALRESPTPPGPGIEYPDDGFGAGLHEIARLIKANVGLEVACIDLGGWDTHFVQGGVDGLHGRRVDLLSRGLAALHRDTAGSGHQVTTVVITEFGRRLYENGSRGTDHGRGFALLALGDGIRGGRVLGDWTGVEEEQPPGPTGLRIAHDYRSVLAELLRGVIGNERVERDVFPGVALQPVGLA